MKDELKKLLKRIEAMPVLHRLPNGGFPVSELAQWKELWKDGSKIIRDMLEKEREARWKQWEHTIR